MCLQPLKVQRSWCMVVRDAQQPLQVAALLPAMLHPPTGHLQLLPLLASHRHPHPPSFRLMLQASHGPRVVLLLQKLLPPGQVDALQEGPPDAAVRCLDRVVETPECLWDMQMAAAAAAEVATLAATLRKQQVGQCVAHIGICLSVIKGHYNSNPLLVL